MHIKMILPSLQEAGSPGWRPIKYSLFPPLGLATLAAMTDQTDDVELVDQHVESIGLVDDPDLVVIQVYITNASRAYRIADHYRSKGCHVCLGGLHVTSLPSEALKHADTIFLGPGDDTFPEFLRDFRRNMHHRIYRSTRRTLDLVPRPRRDLIKRERYLVPNSLVVSRGCPHHCNFCYKDAFFDHGKSFYTQKVDDALNEIERLPGKHLYFLDDHLLGNPRFARSLFEGMEGMGRLFQGASTVSAVLKDDLIEKAADAGLRSLFLGFESINARGLMLANKRQSPGEQHDRAIRRRPLPGKSRLSAAGRTTSNHLTWIADPLRSGMPLNSGISAARRPARAGLAPSQAVKDSTTRAFSESLRSYGDIPDSEARRFLACTSQLNVPSGDFFVRAGEPVTRFAFSLSGLFRYYYIDEKGNEFTKGFLPERRFIASYSAMIARRSSFFSIQAIEDSQLLAIRYEDWLRILPAHPCWSSILIALLEQAYIFKEDREREFLLLDAERRYRAFLEAFPGIEGRIKQHMVASYLGITPVALSRIRKKMGLINPG